jgi:hypothetical protein
LLLLGPLVTGPPGQKPKARGREYSFSIYGQCSWTPSLNISTEACTAQPPTHTDTPALVASTNNKIRALQHLLLTQPSVWPLLSLVLGVGGWLHNVQGKYHVFSKTCLPPLFFPMHPPLYCELHIALCHTILSYLSYYEFIYSHVKCLCVSPEVIRFVQRISYPKDFQPCLEHGEMSAPGFVHTNSAPNNSGKCL